MKYTLIFSALLIFGTTLAASAAPKTTVHTKAAPKKATPAAAPAKAIQPVPGGFPDVPADHWAAQSVETLRKAGIVKGYPAHGK